MLQLPLLAGDGAVSYADLVLWVTLHSLKLCKIKISSTWIEFCYWKLSSSKFNFFVCSSKDPCWLWLFSAWSWRPAVLTGWVSPLTCSRRHRYQAGCDVQPDSFFGCWAVSKTFWPSSLLSGRSTALSWFGVGSWWLAACQHGELPFPQTVSTSTSPCTRAPNSPSSLQVGPCSVYSSLYIELYIRCTTFFGLWRSCS